jgi:hypothetical protein
MSNQSESEGISLKGFASASHETEFAAYISALEAFDRLEQLQELKTWGANAPASALAHMCSRLGAASD